MSPPHMAQATAPGKLILIGEHAVVYRHGAIALPVGSMGVTATIEPTDGPLRLKCALWHGELTSEVPVALQGLACAALAALSRLEAPKHGLVIRLESDIPIGCGLGSSAAAAVALVRALYSAFGQTASLHEVLRLAHQAETLSHGRASGLDAETVARSAPLWFKHGEPTLPLELPGTLSLVVADTGKPRQTQAAIASVKAALDSSATARASLARLGVIADDARTCLAHNKLEALGRLLSEAHAHLGFLGVGDPTLDALCEAALAAGALGAKLTGAGQGGCMLALAPDSGSAEALAQTLRAHGAAQTWVVTLKGPA